MIGVTSSILLLLYADAPDASERHMTTAMIIARNLLFIVMTSVYQNSTLPSPPILQRIAATSERFMFESGRKLLFSSLPPRTPSL